ncbi:hypothetical protein FB451DRAFT_1186383 [Mycena latifolia]|nr:hypothetical protein FB451DRAFT_1186383 [Mycena latifolia]
MFKQLYSTAILAIAILAHGASAAPQTPPPGLGVTCGTFLGVTQPACKAFLYFSALSAIIFRSRLAPMLPSTGHSRHEHIRKRDGKIIKKSSKGSRVNSPSTT